MALDDQIAALARRLGELERRFAGARRTGVVVEADPVAGRYRVRLRSAGDGGAPVLTPWIPLRAMAMGALRVHAPVSIGEQVTVESENGDLTDAVITGSLTSEARPSPDGSADVLVIDIGETRLTLTATGATLKTPTLRLEATEAARIVAPTIVLEGDVALGGEGGQPVHRIGDKDSDDDVAETGASRVTAL